MQRRCRLPGKNAGGTKCCRAVARARRVSREGGCGSRGGGTSKGGEAESQRGEMSAAGKGVVWERNSTFLQPDGSFLPLKYNNKASPPVQHFLFLCPQVSHVEGKDLLTLAQTRPTRRAGEA